MSRSIAHVVTAAAGLLLLGAASTAAETFYNQDGIRLSATVQEIDPGAAICRIREASHSDQEYAKLKPNEGQPLDVWRVEVLVANYSGKQLDYLNVFVNVESSWPPCDNWDGGPDAQYGAPVVWTGPLMSIQDVGTVEPGEEVRKTAFVLAWHEDEPALDRWFIDYHFVGAPPAGTANSTAGSRPGSAAAESSAAPNADTPAAEQNDPAAGVRPEDTCADKAVGASCWMEVANQTGCYTWNPNFQRGETVTWTGDCTGGRASGTGERTWNYTNEEGEPASSSGTGELRGGKEKNGHWVERFADGTVGEGPYVDDEPSGHWVVRFPSGRVEEGPYVDGKRNGHWVLRFADDVQEGPYVDGKRHGRWVMHFDGGAFEEGPYVNGIRHGRWVLKDVGLIKFEEGPFVDGKRHGRWYLRWGDEEGEEGSVCYVNNEHSVDDNDC